MAEDEGEARYIKTSTEKIGWAYLIFEIIKTLIEINIIIAVSIFRFFVPVAKKDLRGEVVVITGAAGYVGRLLALRFAEKGKHLGALAYMGNFKISSNIYASLVCAFEGLKQL